MTGHLNAFVSGAWTKHEDAAVTVLSLTPNGRACYVTLGDSKKRRGPVPLRWVTMEAEPESEPIAAPERCPHCGQEML